MAISEGLMFGIFAMLTIGLADFFAKKAVGKYNPLTALKVSLVLGTVIVLVYSLLFIEFPVITTNVVIFVLFAGATGALGWITFYRGLKQGKVSIVSPIASSWGLIPFILAIAILSESLTTFQVLFSVSIFVGIFLTSVDWKKFIKLSKKKLYAGAGLSILALIGFGLSGFFTKFVVDDIGAFYTIVLIRLVSLFLIFLYVPKNQQRTKFDFRWIWILILIGFLDAIGYLSFTFGLSVGLVSIVSAVTSAAPVVLVLLAYFFLKERLKSNQYFGIFLIIAGFVGLSLI